MTTENRNSSASQKNEQSLYSTLYEISIDFETHWGQEGWSIENCLESVDEDLKLELFRRLLEIDLTLSNQNKYNIDPNDYKNRFPQWKTVVEEIVAQTNCQEIVNNTEIIEIRIGTYINNYRFESLLGRGGMGVVYKAFDEGPLQRKVAIKVLLVDSKTQQERSKRFQWEMRLLARLPGTAFANAYECIQEGENLFLVMEYIDGVDLRKFVVELHNQKQSVSCLKALRYIREIAENLQVLHQLGIVHRDIKPENIMLNSAGKIRILDLGLGTLTDDSVLQGEMRPDRPKSTQTGGREIAGSPPYMPPEVFLSEAIDTRSDLYSLGGTFFFLLTNGILPSQWFDASKYYSEEPPSLKKFFQDRKISLPRDVFAILSKLLQKDLEKRYQTAAEVCDDLDAAINRRSTQAILYRRLKALNATLSAFVVLIFGLYYFCAKPYFEIKKMENEAIRHYQAAKAYFNKGKAEFDPKKYSSAFGEIEQIPNEFIPKIGNDYYFLRAKIKKNWVTPSRSHRIAERLYLEKLDFEHRDRIDLEDAKADLDHYISVESSEARPRLLDDAYRQRSEINLALAAHDPTKVSTNEISTRLSSIDAARNDVDSAIEERKKASRPTTDLELLKARIFIVFGEFFKYSSFDQFEPDERVPDYWQEKASEILETIINSNGLRFDELALAYYWRATLYWLKDDGRLELVESDLNGALDELEQKSLEASETNLNDDFIESGQKSIDALKNDIKAFRAFVRFETTKRQCVSGDSIAREILADLENETTPGDNEFCLIKSVCYFYLNRWEDFFRFCNHSTSDEIKAVREIASFFSEIEPSPNSLKYNSNRGILFYWNKYWVLQPESEDASLIVRGYRVFPSPESSEQRDFILKSQENANKFVEQIQKDGIPLDWVFDPPCDDDEEEVVR